MRERLVIVGLALGALVTSAEICARDVVLDGALSRQIQRWDADVAAGLGSTRCNAAYHRARQDPAAKDTDVRLRETGEVSSLCRADNDASGRALVLADAFADMFTRDLDPETYQRLILATLSGALELLEDSHLDPVLVASLTALATEVAFVARDLGGVERLADAADQKFERLAINRSRSLAIALANMGYARNALNDPEGALKALGRAEAIALELDTADPMLLATIYRRLASVLYRQSRYDRALAYTDKAIDVLPETSQQLQRATLNYNKGGMLLELGVYDGAIDAFTRAKNIYLLRGDEKNLASAMWSLGKVWHQKGLRQRALQLYLQAERIQSEHGYNQDLMRTCISLGILHENLSTAESYAEAARYYDKAESLYRADAAGRSDNDTLLSLATNRGKLYERLRRYDKAESEYLGAEKLVTSSGRVTHVLYNNIAFVSLQMGKFDQALRYAHKAIERLDETINTGFYIQGAGNLQFIEQSQTPYAIASRASLALGDVPGALAMHEAGRNRVRQIMVRLRQSLKAGDESDKRWQQRTDIDRQLATINQRAAQSPSDTERAALTVRRAALEADRARVEGSLFQRPELYGKVFGPRRVDPKGIQADLAADEALIDYQFEAWGQSDRRLRVKAFVIRSNSIRSIDLFDGAMGDESIGLLAEYVDLQKPQTLLRHQREGALDHYSTKLDSGARRLHELLFAKLEPELKGAERLIIIPSGPLNLLPFEALKDKQGRFLVESHVISYVTSADDVRRRASRPAGKALVVGDIKYGAKREGLRTWQAIGDSTHVLDDVAKSLSDSAATAQLRGGDATESRFKALAPGNRVLIIWTHGKFDDRQQAPDILEGATDKEGGVSITTPEELEEYVRHQQLQQFADPLSNAFVVFAGVNQGGDGANDGYLTAREVMNLDLDSVDLTVLAACETGLGQASSSEGLLGLQWAFSLAGSRQLLLSLWQVDADWTGTLLNSFIAKQPGVGSARALQQAKVALIRQLRQQGLEAFPFYWAGFVLTGR